MITYRCDCGAVNFFPDDGGKCIGCGAIIEMEDDEEEEVPRRKDWLRYLRPHLVFFRWRYILPVGCVLWWMGACFWVMVAVAFYNQMTAGEKLLWNQGYTSAVRPLQGNMTGASSAIWLFCVCVGTCWTIATFILGLYWKRPVMVVTAVVVAFLGFFHFGFWMAVK